MSDDEIINSILGPAKPVGGSVKPPAKVTSLPPVNNSSSWVGSGGGWLGSGSGSAAGVDKGALETSVLTVSSDPTFSTLWSLVQTAKTKILLKHPGASVEVHLNTATQIKLAALFFKSFSFQAAKDPLADSYLTKMLGCPIKISKHAKDNQLLILAAPETVPSIPGVKISPPDPVHSTLWSKNSGEFHLPEDDYQGNDVKQSSSKVGYKIVQFVKGPMDGINQRLYGPMSAPGTAVAIPGQGQDDPYIYEVQSPLLDGEEERHFAWNYESELVLVTKEMTVFASQLVAGNSDAKGYWAALREELDEVLKAGGLDELDFPRKIALIKNPADHCYVLEMTAFTVQPKEVEEDNSGDD